MTPTKQQIEAAAVAYARGYSMQEVGFVDGANWALQQNRWIDPELHKPIHGQKIITQSAVGLFWGVFYAISNGVVYIEDKQSITVWWDEIYEWFPYPEPPQQ